MIIMTNRNVKIIILAVVCLALQSCSGSGNWSLPGAANNTPPVVVITSPLAGSISDEGVLVTFTGSANDPEDGALSGGSFVWTSDRDGQIGTGQTFDITTLRRGIHIITLTATDQSGGQGTASITITVRTPWLDAQWGFRQQIIISASMAPADQTDFPVLIQITDQLNPLFNSALANGDDILFTDMDGVVQLDHEIELYDNAGTEELDAWVRIPNLSSTVDTVIYMYYGNPGAANQENMTAVWSNNFLMVHHLSETPADDVADGHVNSTLNGNNGTARHFQDVGGGSTDAAGKIAGADDLAGDTDGNWQVGPDFPDYIRVGPNSGNALTIFDNNPVYSFSVWVNAPPQTNATIYSEGSWYYVPFFSIQTKWNEGGRLHYRLLDASWSHGAAIYSNATDVLDNTWKHIAITDNNGDVNIYINGVLDINDSYDRQPCMGWPTYEYCFGNLDRAAMGIWTRLNGEYGYFDGLIDEMKFSSGIRSADWILTGYNNQDNPAVFLTFAVEEMY